MIPIVKSQEPNSLREHKCLPNSDYDGVSKQYIRESLVQEQGFLCAYCMGRIEPKWDEMRIEHWHCQDNYKREQLDYKNMLGCCCGNEGKGKSPKLQHCDVSKKNKDIDFNPSNTAHHERLKIKYSTNGVVESEYVSFDNQLNKVLHLNIEILKKNRLAAFKAMKARLKKEDGYKRNKLEKMLVSCKTKDTNGKLPEYCGIVAYFLEKKLRACP